MSTPSQETIDLVQKHFVLVVGRPADTSLAPSLAQQITDAGNTDGFLAGVNAFLAGQAAAIGAENLVILMAQQGLGITLPHTLAAGFAGMIARGELTWGGLASLAAGLGGSFGDTLGNRADAAQAFTDALTSQDKGALYTGASLFDAAHDLLAGVTSDALTVTPASQSLEALVTHLGPDGLGVPAADGYLAGATVFVDGDGDGELDAGEFSTTADESGDFGIPASAGTGDLVAFGGTDLLTGQPFAGYMTAPSGATVINPLTTLVKGVLDGGFAASAQAAADLVVAALGLPAGINLLTYDPMAVFASGTATPEELAQALAVEAKALQVINLITQAAVSIDSATGLDLAQSAGLIIDALAQAAASGEPLDLTDAGTIAGIIGDAVSNLLGGAPLGGTLTAIIAQIAEITAASNQAAEAAGSLHDLAQVASVAQGDVVDALKDVFGNGGSLGDAVTAFTGDNLQAAIDAAPVGEIVPGLPVPGNSVAAPTIDAGPDFTDTSITFTAGDTDAGDTLSLAAPFTFLGAVNDGSSAVLTLVQQATVIAGDLVVTDGTFDTPVGVYLALGTQGADEITAGGTTQTALYGFVGDDSLIGGTQSDRLFGGDGKDTLSGGGADDSLTGGLGRDSLTGGAGSDSFFVDAGLDTITDLSGEDTLGVAAHATASATVTAAWAAASATTNDGVANLSSAGFDVDLSAIVATTNGFTVTNTGAAATFTGSSGGDTLVGAAGNDTLNGGAGDDSLNGSSSDDSLTGGVGADTSTGGLGADTFVFAAGDTVLSITGNNAAGVITGYDVISTGDFTFDAAGDTIDTVGTAAVVADGAVDGTDSALELNTNSTVASHSTTNGIVTFDDANTFDSAVALTSTNDVAAVVQYLQLQDLGTAGATVAFTATIGAVAHTFLFTQGDDGGTNASGVLVDLVGVTATAVSASAAAADTVFIV